MKLLMPSTAELIRHTPSGRALRNSTFLLLLALLVAAGPQTPLVGKWWVENLALADELIPPGPDPIGFYLVPKMALASGPAVAVLCLSGFVFAALLGLAVRSDSVVRALTACALLQAGLIGAFVIHSRGALDLADTVRQFVARASDQRASEQVTGWIARYDRASTTFGTPLAWLFLVSLLLLVIATIMLEKSSSEPVMLGRTGDRAIPPTIAAQFPDAPSEFDASMYSVRPRRNWLGPFDWKPSEYDVDSIPPASNARYSLSWTTGAIRREPDGAAILTVRAAPVAGVFGHRSYAVADYRTGAAIGTLAPNGFDWEMRDPAGRTFASVLEVERGAGRARYIAKAGEQEIVRFVWGFTGMTVLSTELEVEFLPGAHDRARALAIALGPILEQRARRSSERSM
jgi:hypothetical protein